MSSELTKININRLTQYHSILSDFEYRNENFITVSQLSSLLKTDIETTLEDLKSIEYPEQNLSKINVTDLKNHIESFLGFKKIKKAFIIGAGNLGTALAKYRDFEDYGLNILALFDNDKSKFGTTINNKIILDISKLPNLVKKSKVDIAILTVPKKYAQIMATYIAAAGIKYIWNFTPAVLDVPDDVKVLNENIIENLLKFTSEQ